MKLYFANKRFFYIVSQGDNALHKKAAGKVGEFHAIVVGL